MFKKGKRKNRSRRIKRQKEEALGRSPNQYISKREEGELYIVQPYCTVHSKIQPALREWKPVVMLGTLAVNMYPSRARYARSLTHAILWLTLLVHCNENPIYVFLFWDLRGLSPNFHIQVSVSDLYIPRGLVHIFPAAESAYQSWEYINRSQTHECGNWD
jgi:hypothetical protein